MKSAGGLHPLPNVPPGEKKRTVSEVLCCVVDVFFPGLAALDAHRAKRGEFPL